MRVTLERFNNLLRGWGVCTPEEWDTLLGLRHAKKWTPEQTDKIEEHLNNLWGGALLALFDGKPSLDLLLALTPSGKRDDILLTLPQTSFDDFRSEMKADGLDAAAPLGSTLGEAQGHFAAQGSTCSGVRKDAGRDQETHEPVRTVQARLLLLPRVPKGPLARPQVRLRRGE